MRGVPFAWNGIIAWWLVLTVFAGWIVVTTALTIRAITNDTTGPGPDPGNPADVVARVRALEDELDAWKRRFPVPEAGTNGATSSVGAGPS